MKKVNKKKGFTLAELLVVLAIMAVLVAIAVPLFMGAVGDANESVIDANERSLKSAALIQVNADPALGSTGPWIVEADINGSGEISNLTVKVAGTGDSGERPAQPEGHYKVLVESVDITTGS